MTNIYCPTRYCKHNEDRICTEVAVFLSFQDDDENKPKLTCESFEHEDNN